MEQERIDTYMQNVPRIHRYLHLRYRNIDVLGLENIPDTATVFGANHLRFDDSLLIAMAYAEEKNAPLRLFAKREYFDGKGINNRGLLGKTLQRFVINTGQIPVDREENARGVVQLGKDTADVLGRGESLLVHQEGTRSPDGRLHKFQIGATKFALKASVPLDPVSATYPNEKPNLLARRFDPRPTAVIQFGEPLMPQNYGMELRHFPLIPDAMADAIAIRSMKQSKRVEIITDSMEQRVAELSGQERSGYRIHPITKQFIMPDGSVLPQ